MKRRTRKSPLIAATATALAFTGCGESPTNTGNGSLTQVEAVAIFDEIMSAAFSVSSPAMSTSPWNGSTFQAALAPSPVAAINLDLTLDETVPCEAGGSIGVGGTLSIDIDDNEVGTYVYHFAQNPSDCVVATETGAEYRVNGNPNIQMSGGFSIAGGEPTGTFEMSFSGGLRWHALNGGAYGSCTLQISYTLDWATLEGSADGHICGYDVNQEFGLHQSS